jgi:hypothetical protein
MQGRCSNSAHWNEADSQGFLTPHVSVQQFSHKKIKPHYQRCYISWMEKNELYGYCIPQRFMMNKKEARIKK